MDLEARLSAHLQRVCGEIGPRPIGSPGDRAAADYIRRAFRASGLEIEEQRHPCPAWREEETHLELNGERLVAAANAYSPGVEVLAPTVAAATLVELESADLRGRIAVLYGDLARSPLTTKGCVLYEAERDWKIVSLLEEKGPEAIITVNPRLGCVERIIEDWEFSIPSATVPAEVGLVLLDGYRSLVVAGMADLQNHDVGVPLELPDVGFGQV